MKLQAAVRHAYGDKCACCGETEPLFLTLDHVNGDGATHRRTLRTNDVHAWARKNGYPPSLQLLCWNCNAAKAYHGGCPHKRGSQAAWAV